MLLPTILRKQCFETDCIQINIIKSSSLIHLVKGIIRFSLIELVTLLLSYFSDALQAFLGINQRLSLQQTPLNRLSLRWWKPSDP